MRTVARRASVLTRSRGFQVALLASGLVLIVTLSWLVNHGDSFMFTMHYNYYFGDLEARVTNLADLRRTGNIYVPFGDGAFTYPPGAILFFWPIQWIPAQHLTLVWTLGSVVALAAAMFVAVASMSRSSRLLLAGLCCWGAVVAAIIFPEVTECLTWGQTATILLLMVLLDVLVVRGHAQGVLVGVATAVKIYPGLFIIMWMLRRQWQAALTALATTAVITAAAFVAWPASGSDFVHDLIFGGEEFQKLAGNLNAFKSNSFIALFQRPPFHYGLISSHVDVAISVAVMALCVYAAHRLWRRHLEFSAVIVLLIAGAIGSPAAWDHYFAFAPLMVLVVWEAGVNTALGRTALVATVVSIVPWFLFRTPAIATPWTATYAFAARNALLLASLSIVVVALVGDRSPRGRHAAGRRDSRSVKPVSA